MTNRPYHRPAYRDDGHEVCDADGQPINVYVPCQLKAYEHDENNPARHCREHSRYTERTGSLYDLTHAELVKRCADLELAVAFCFGVAESRDDNIILERIARIPGGR